MDEVNTKRIRETFCRSIGPKTFFSFFQRMNGRKGFVLSFDIRLMIIMLFCKLSFERLSSDKGNFSLNLVYNVQFTLSISQYHSLQRLMYIITIITN